MFDYSGKLNKNVVDQIQYRGTMVTGEITEDNGDGTYDVKIAQSDKAYPNVETAFPNTVFSVGDIVLVTFEYGNREMPRILGYTKRVAQHPVDVEVDYSDPTFLFGIDMGSPKTELESHHSFGWTYIAKENPANGTGKIASINLRAGPSGMTGVIIVIFTEVSTNVFTARDRVYLADIPYGSNVIRTIDINHNPISLNVVVGDYIGMYWAGGNNEFEEMGVGTWHSGGDHTSCVGHGFVFLVNRTVRLYGIG